MNHLLIVSSLILTAITIAITGVVLIIFCTGQSQISSQIEDGDQSEAEENVQENKEAEVIPESINCDGVILMDSKSTKLPNADVSVKKKPRIPDSHMETTLPEVLVSPVDSDQHFETIDLIYYHEFDSKDKMNEEQDNIEKEKMNNVGNKKAGTQKRMKELLLENEDNSLHKTDHSLRCFSSYSARVSRLSSSASSPPSPLALHSFTFPNYTSSSDSFPVVTSPFSSSSTTPPPSPFSSPSSHFFPIVSSSVSAHSSSSAPSSSSPPSSSSSSSTTTSSSSCHLSSNSSTRCKSSRHSRSKSKCKNKDSIDRVTAKISTTKSGAVSGSKMGVGDSAISTTHHHQAKVTVGITITREAKTKMNTMATKTDSRVKGKTKTKAKVGTSNNSPKENTNPNTNTTVVVLNNLNIV